MADDPEVIKAESGDQFNDSLPPKSSPSSDHHFVLPEGPIPEKRHRTASASERAFASPVIHGKITKFCREKGHGFISPHDGSPPIFVHCSDIDGDTVPKEGDEVIFKTILMPPKMEKMQAVHVQIIAMKPGVKHEHWENTTIAE